jgi:AcrR family transcriptional regulator
MSPPPPSSRRKLPGAKPAKQARSQATLDRISDAVIALLRDKPFDELSIAEIVEASNISTGTFYRRFDSKQALLPLLFERYAMMMRDWFEALTGGQTAPSLEAFVHGVVTETHALYSEHRNFIRAVHLHARYRPELIDRGSVEQRMGPPLTYHSFLEPFAGELGPPFEEAAPFLYFVLTTTMNEWMLYPEHGTARTLPMDDADFCAHLETMLLNYLRKPV